LRSVPQSQLMEQYWVRSLLSYTVAEAVPAHRAAGVVADVRQQVAHAPLARAK
jgi:hypothetical protein